MPAIFNGGRSRNSGRFKPIPVARWAASCSRNSGVKPSPKSSAPMQGRISMSESSSIGFGHFFTHSIASANDFTFHNQNPATSSSVCAKGPAVTVRLSPANRTRTPRELGSRPSPEIMMPAVSNSSLYLPMAVISLVSASPSGIFPASELSVALTRIMTFMVRLPSQRWQPNRFQSGLSIGPDRGQSRCRSCGPC